MITKKSRAVLLGVVGLTSIAGGVMTASASSSDCASSYVCLWRDADYGGGIKPVGKSPDTYDVSGDFNDMTSSWYNKSTKYDARWFYNSSGEGTSRCMNSQSFLSYVGGVDNDELSMVRIYTDALAC